MPKFLQFDKIRSFPTRLKKLNECSIASRRRNWLHSWRERENEKKYEISMGKEPIEP